MKRKIGLIGGIGGVIGGILLVVAAIMESAFPKPLWVVAAVCCTAGAVSNFINLASARKKGEDKK